MATTRGYGTYNEAGNTFFKPKKRTYHPCKECGEQTWSKTHVCSNCSGRTEKKNKYYMGVRYKDEAYWRDRNEKATKVYKLLRDTDLSQMQIADQLGLSDNFVNRIRLGHIHKDITGGYVNRPHELDGEFKMTRNLSPTVPTTRKLAKLVYDKLVNTSLSYREIEKLTGATKRAITMIARGEAYTDITGGPVVRPWGAYKGKLLEEEVGEIVRLLRETDLTHGQIAGKFFVTKNTVSNIQNGRTHTDITGGVVLRRWEIKYGPLGRGSKALPFETVQEIVHLLRTSKIKQTEIARRFDIRAQIVNDIRGGRNYVYITGGRVYRPGEKNGSE